MFNVISGFVWPRMVCALLTSAPLAMSSVAAVCRSAWNVVPDSSTRSTRGAKCRRAKLENRTGVPAAVVNTNRVG